MSLNVRLAFASLCLSPCAAWCTPTYSVIDLGFLPNGSFSQALAVNDSDQAVGVAGTATTGHAFLWDGRLRDIHPVGEVGSSAAAGINNSGTVVMTATFKAFKYANGVTTPLLAANNKPMSFATGISESGLIVGGSFGPGQPTVATVWGVNLIQGVQLGLITGAEGSNGFGINDLGDVAGDCTFNNLSRACYFNAGWFWSGGWSQRGGLNAVSPSRWAVGRLDGLDHTAILVNLATNVQYTIPLMADAKGAQAFSINRNGVVVGTADMQGGWPHGFVWTPDQGMEDLNSHLDDFGAANYTITDAHGINSRGVIACTANMNGQQRAVLLVPDTRDLGPQTMVLNLGKVSNGDLSSLASADGNSLEVCKSFLPNLTVAPIQVTLESTCPVDRPQTIRFRTLSRATATGSFSQTVQLWDWTVGSFDDSRTDNLYSSWKQLDLYGSSSLLKPLSRLVEPGTGRMRAKVSVKAIGFVSNPNWCVQYDEASWSVNL